MKSCHVCVAVLGRGHAAASREQESVPESRGIHLRRAQPVSGHHSDLFIHFANLWKKPWLKVHRVTS